MLLVVVLVLLGFAVSCFTALALWIVYLHHRYSHIPGPERDSFILGNIPAIYRRGIDGPFLDLVCHWFNEFGPVICVWLAMEPVVLCNDPVIIKDLLVNKDYPKCKRTYTLLQHMFKIRSLGNGLVTELNKEKWKERRQIINPAFHRLYLKSLIPKFNNSADVFVKKLQNLADGNCVVDMSQEFHRVTLDVIAKIDFRTYGRQKEFDEGTRVVRQYGSKCVAERKYMLSKGEKLPNDIMSLVVEKAASDPNITDEDLIDEFVTFIIAGQDTTASLLSFLLFSLLENPSVMKRLKDEIDIVLHDNKDVTFEDLGKMKFMGQCIKETLRLYPPAASFNRVTPCIDKYGDYEIPKGTMTSIFLFSMHRDPRYWPKPEIFDPDRWERDSADNPGITSAFMPFSSGPRNCIGRLFAEFEAKIILAKLLQTFQITLVPGTRLEVGVSGTLRPRNGVPITLMGKRPIET
ncbi:cholesterol 24-hydroxylase-like isoform X2 [Rhopilema esculentum]|uniref:cholesterol 24-hydroxylase-like isoform X2 n=1 Tax=Rhopilema esculentum TaxID=499914 RepID=UPI0031E20490